MISFSKKGDVSRFFFLCFDLKRGSIWIISGRSLFAKSCKDEKTNICHLNSFFFGNMCKQCSTSKQSAKNHYWFSNK